MAMGTKYEKALEKATDSIALDGSHEDLAEKLIKGYDIFINELFNDSRHTITIWKSLRVDSGPPRYLDFIEVAKNNDCKPEKLDVFRDYDSFDIGYDITRLETDAEVLHRKATYLFYKFDRFLFNAFKNLGLPYKTGFSQEYYKVLTCFDEVEIIRPALIKYIEHHTIKEVPK